MRIQLTRLIAGEPVSSNPLRDETITGTLYNDVEVGNSLILITTPRDNPDATARVVTTSHVKEIEKVSPGVIRIRTETGSLYEVAEMGE